MPGSGKTSACAYMKEKGYNVLMICPTNVLLITLQKETGIVCKTFDEFFGISFNDPENKVKKKKKTFDISPYNCFVFDEIYFKSNPCDLMRVLRFIQNHPDTIVLATGDPHQLHIEDKKR